MKALNYAMTTEAGRGNCLRFVDAQGLKVLFPIFMGKDTKKLKKTHSKTFIESEDEGKKTKSIHTSLATY